MTLSTVQVPAALAPIFERAEGIVSRYFAEQRSDPAHGSIEIHGERYVLVRAAALSVEFFGLVAALFGPGRDVEAEAFAQGILFDLAHAIGKADARNFHTQMGLVDPIDRLSAGPVHFAHAGWAKVEISAESQPEAGDDYYMLFDHTYSFEADAWVRAGQRRAHPACIMNAGYSSGWCAESFGIELVTVEVLCRACGDEACRFIMAPPLRIEAQVERFHRRRPGGGTQRLPIPDFFSRKRTEEELRRTQDELERRVAARTAELVRANEQLKLEMEERERAEARLLQTDKLEAVGRLAGGIAHDFNNLMAIITVNCELLERRVAELPEAFDLVGFVDDISAAGARAAGLTRQLLAFSRAAPTTGTSIELNGVVGELGRMLERVLGEDVVLETHLGEGLGVVALERSQLEQILMNLVMNARDAMPTGGALTVETRAIAVDAAAVAAIARHASGAGELRPGPHAVLVVRDTGTGMDAATVARIFEPFFTTKEVGKGTGLGLATVYGIVHRAGGAITVTSAPGEGTELSIYLPESRLPEAPPRRAPASEPPPEAQVGTGTILVVEDQARLREVIVLVLRGLGYEVLAAGDADAALAVAATHAGPIDLLLTDVVMPRRSGPALAAEMRALRPGVAVVFMSGYAPDAITRGGALTKDDTLLAKPFGPDELERVVRAALARAQQISSGSSRA
jgi:signal transduction histidine kinase/CheY-like chemotaxis protein